MSHTEEQRHSFYAAVARVIGAFMGAGSGSMIYHLMGDDGRSWLVAGVLLGMGFLLVWGCEYLRLK